MTISYISDSEAASFAKNGQTIAFSGFTPAGSPKLVPLAIANRAKDFHSQGKPFKIKLISGASLGEADDVLARANAISLRAPYQTNDFLRNAINGREVESFDMHLSIFPQSLDYGFAGEIDLAVIEVSSISQSGEIVLSSAVGSSPTFIKLAKKVIIELNESQPSEFRGMHDIYMPELPPNRRHIPIYNPEDRIGSEVIKIPLEKIVGIVKTNKPDCGRSLRDSDPVTEKIGENIAEFLAFQMKKGLIPSSFLPLQSGVGNIANAALGAIGRHNSIPVFKMYSEVVQDSVIELIKNEKVSFASASALAISHEVAQEVYENIKFFKSKIILRPQEITNNPEVIRRLGVIALNTAIELDVFGNVNSSHFNGSKLMNGIGGSGDFTRNGYISIFSCPSTAKNGLVSTIVPFCSHIDHTEHDTQIIVTEQGVADLRFKSPVERANLLINNCAHPDYRELLKEFLKINKNGHIPMSLKNAFAFHSAFEKCSDMRKTTFVQ